MAHRVFALAAPEVPFEADEFTRRFEVRCDDPRFATAFLEPRVIQALLASTDQPMLAISEDRMLLVCGQLRPAAILGLLHRAGELAAAAPRVLVLSIRCAPGSARRTSPRGSASRRCGSDGVRGGELGAGHRASAHTALRV
ncbi:MAG: hypothetical protein ABR600_12325, partial [Actinomycetota bacterium]